MTTAASSAGRTIWRASLTGLPIDLEERGRPFSNLPHALFHALGRDDPNAVPLREAGLNQEGVEILSPVGLENRHRAVLAVDVRPGDDLDVVLFGDLRDLRPDLEHERPGLGVADRAHLR